MAKKLKSLPTGLYWKNGSIWGSKMVRGVRDRFSCEAGGDIEKAYAYFCKRTAQLSGNSAEKIASKIATDAALKEYMVYVRGSRSEATSIRYQTSANQLCAFFGDKPLVNINHSAMSDFVKSRKNDPGRGSRMGAKAKRTRKPGAPRRKVSLSSIAYDIAVLRQCFDWALNNEWVAHNPVPAFLKRERFEMKKSAPRERYLSEDEEAIAIAHFDRRLAELRLSGTERQLHSMIMLRAVVILHIEVGLRTEEMQGAVIGDINLETRQWTVRPAVAKYGKGRVVALTKRAVQVIDDLPRPRDYIGHNRRPVIWHGQNVQQYTNQLDVFQAEMAKVGINDITMHDLRRTCGCRLLQKYDFSMKRISVWLGHKSVSVTEKHYAFLLKTDKRQEIGQLDTIDAAVAKQRAAELDAVDDRAINVPLPGPALVVA